MPLTVAETEKELAAAIKLEHEVKTELDQTRALFAEAEKTAGDRSLEARKAGDVKAMQRINDGVLKLKSQQVALLLTHRAARDAIQEARKAVNMTKARALRDDAQILINQVNERQQKTNELLKALHEHEGIRYLPEPQSRAGVYIGGTAESKTAKLIQEAAFLIRQAETLEALGCPVELPPAPYGRMSNAETISL